MSETPGSTTTPAASERRAKVTFDDSITGSSRAATAGNDTAPSLASAARTDTDTGGVFSDSLPLTAGDAATTSSSQAAPASGTAALGSIAANDDEDDGAEPEFGTIRINAGADAGLDGIGEEADSIAGSQRTADANPMSPGAASTATDASLIAFQEKANRSKKNILDVIKEDAVQAAVEVDRQAASVMRSEAYKPVNPFVGDAIEMPDAKDDTIMGVTLTEEQISERQRTEAFEEANHTRIEHHCVAGFNFRPTRGNRAPRGAHVDEDSVCFSAGRHLHVAKLLDPTNHRVQPRTPRCIDVVDFCISSNGKYVAIAERLANAPHVTIYKTDSSTRIASLNFRHLTTTYVEKVTFSSNNNFLLCATAMPHQRLIMWQLSDVKVIGVLDDVTIRNHPCPLPLDAANGTAVLSSIAVNPWSSFAVATGTDQGFSLWRLSGRNFSCEVQVSTVSPAGKGAVSAVGQLAAASTASPTSASLMVDEAPGVLRPVSDVCWYDENCCAGLTTDGVLVVVEDRAVKQRLRLRVPPPPASAFSPIASKPQDDELGSVGAASLSVKPGSPRSLLGGEDGHVAEVTFEASIAASSPRHGSAGRMSPKMASMHAAPKMSHLVWASRGLIAAGADGSIVLLDRTYAEPCFVQTCVLRVGVAPSESGRPRFPAITALSVSPGETNVVVGLDDNSLLCMAMNDLNDAIADAEMRAEAEMEEAAAAELRQRQRAETADLFEGSGELADASASQTKMATFRAVGTPEKQQPTAGDGESSPASARQTRTQALERLQSGIVVAGVGVAFYQPAFAKRVEHLSFHSANVTSICTCIQRPLIATTSSDKTLRVYNYEENVFILTARMEDEILSAALHPTGLYVVVCFHFFTRVYAILPRGLHFVEDINIKPAYEVRFSNLGGRIAFAVNNRVILVDAHTYRIVGGLIGHTAPVKSVSFSMRDETITTADAAGIIYTWDAATMERTTLESSQKNLIFQQAFLEENTGLYCAFGSSKHARGTTYEGEVTLVCSKPGDHTSIVYVRPGMILPKAHATRKTHHQVLAITKTTGTLVVGTPTGRLLMYTWPLLKPSKPYAAVDNHCCEITHVQLSPDERFLFTVGSDNVMFVYDLLHMRDGRYVSTTTFNWSIFDPVVLQHASDSDAVEREAFQLKLKVEQKARENDESLAAIKRQREAEIKARIEHHEREVDALRKSVDAIASEMKRHEKQTTEKAHRVEAQHAASAEEIEVLYSKRAREALARINRIESEREELAAQYEGKVAARYAEMETGRQRLLSKIAERERVLRETIAAHQKLLKQTVKQSDAMIAQTIADYETQIKALEIGHKKTVETHDEKTMRAANTASFGDREADRLRREIVDLQELVNGKREVATSLQGVMARKEKENKVLKKELLVKQEAINQGERRMLTLKQQLSKLENLRFVLTHQYEELRRSYIPKDGEIQSLEARIREMEATLQSSSFERNQVRDQVIAVDARVEALTKASQAQRVKSLDQDRRTKLILEALGRQLDTFSDNATLLKKLKEVITDVTKRQPSAKRIVAAPDARHEEANDEMHTQVDFLASQLVGMQREEVRHDRDLRAMNSRRITENTAMIDEIKEMRKQRKELYAKCNLMEQQLRDACVALHRLADPRRALQSPQQSPKHSQQQHHDDVPEWGSMVPPGASSTELPMAPSPLLPPIECGRSTDRALVTPLQDTPPATADPATQAKRPASQASSRRSAPSSAAPLKQSRSGSTATRAKSSTPTPSVTRKSSAPLPPIEKSKTAKGGAKKPAGATSGKPVQASKSRAARLYERAQLEQMIDRLDGNTETMRRQHEEVAWLRGVVQTLLAQEEARLVSELGRASASPGSSPNISPTKTQAAGARAQSQASFAQPTPAPDEDDGVDWSVPAQPAAEQQQQPQADPAADGRPMTPTRLPASGL